MKYFLKDYTKEQIITKAKAIALKQASSLQLEILDVDYVHEHGINILRIIADSKEGLTIDQSSELNNLISDALDKDDFIDEEYYLEVSSPGLERPLKTSEDIKGAIGEYINIKTYEKLDGLKEFNGYLEKYEDEVLTIDTLIKGQSKKIVIEQKRISKIRLAVKF